MWPRPSRAFTSLTILDEVSAEARPDGSTAKTNHDPAGNPTAACYWKPGISMGACLPAGTTPWPDPARAEGNLYAYAGTSTASGCTTCTPATTPRPSAASSSRTRPGHGLPWLEAVATGEGLADAWLEQWDLLGPMGRRYLIQLQELLGRTADLARLQ